MTRRTIAPIALILAAGLAGGFVDRNLLVETQKPPSLLDQLRSMEIERTASGGIAFYRWRIDHPDIPRTIEFPDVASGPLWDFTLHAVLRGERRTWMWGDTVYATSTTATWTAAGGGGGTTTMYPATCGSTYYPVNTVEYWPRHAASGGGP